MAATKGIPRVSVFGRGIIRGENANPVPCLRVVGRLVNHNLRSEKKLWRTGHFLHFCRGVRFLPISRATLDQAFSSPLPPLSAVIRCSGIVLTTGNTEVHGGCDHIAGNGQCGSPNSISDSVSVSLLPATDAPPSSRRLVRTQLGRYTRHMTVWRAESLHD